MNKLAYILKSSKFLYLVYYYVMSGLLRFLGLFICVDNNLILFNSFGGKKYDDSPKAIYERMILDHRFDKMKFVWAVSDPEKFSIPGRAEVIKSDSFKYFVTSLKAKVWITNSSIERGLNFKKKKTICFNTWHGTPIKVMGIDINEDNQSFKSRVLVRADFMCAQSQYDVDVFSHAFLLPKTNFLLSGLPRNDCLSNYSTDICKQIKGKLGIDKSKKVLLYAPTFREYTKGSSNEVVLDIPMCLQYWQDKLCKDFVVLFRAHYEVAKHMNLEGYPVFIDVSKYPNLNELMIVSDALISDYSSIYFDYSIMHKPMFCFAYDYDDYMSHRGMYLDLNEELPCLIHKTEKDLIDDLLNFETKKGDQYIDVIRFQEKYVSEFGKGAEKCCEKLLEKMGENK